MTQNSSIQPRVIGKALQTGMIFLAFLVANTKAGAAFQGVAGEALLVPFVLYDEANGINTTITITIPSKVGTAKIANEYTAPHTTPSNTPLPTNQLVVHWTFFNKDGVHLLDKILNMLPNTTHSLSWATIVKSIPELNGKPGYLLIQTDAGAHGEQADFNMFADASMSFKSGPASIPVMALSDGKDVLGGNPGPGNEVVGLCPNIQISPLSSGIRTGAANGSAPGRTMFTLPWEIKRSKWVNILYLASPRSSWSGMIVI